MADAYITIKGNEAEINLPADTKVSVRVRVNSSNFQTVELHMAERGFQCGGSGENQLIQQIEIEGETKLFAKFRHSKGGSQRSSTLHSEGPTALGNYNLMLLSAEDGDDADNNDAVMEFSWFS